MADSSPPDATDGRQPSGHPGSADTPWPDGGTPAVPGVELRLLRHESISLRAWFLPFFALMAVLLAVWWFSGRGSTVAAMAFFFGYLSVACTFFPVPTSWIILWAAAPASGGGLGLPPLVVATVGAAATAIANMHDYYLVTFLYRYERIRRVRATSFYRRFADWYNRAPFGTLAAASFLPVPVDFIRLLAISEGYHRLKFALGSLVGRWPRYLAFAILADRFQLSWQWILGIAGATVVLGLWRGLPPLVQKITEAIRARRGAKSEEPSA
jgi:membrane protein YqaA with SNARE-associated domain